jgi:hypothetical protein
LRLSTQLGDPRSGDEAIDPDGMSGAPVFFIYLEDRKEAHLGFAGMVTDARIERYMVYDGALIRQVVDAFIDA